MIIESIGFYQCSGKVGQDYITKYIPPVLQHSDKGGLHLIKPAFFQFARDLLKFCVDANSKKSIYDNINDWIKVGLTEVRVHEALLVSFRKVVLTLHGSIREKLICGIHKQIAEYTMRTFSKRTNNKTFNVESSSAKDKSTTKFRTLIQNGSNPDGDK